MNGSNQKEVGSEASSPDGERPEGSADVSGVLTNPAGHGAERTSVFMADGGSADLSPSDIEQQVARATEEQQIAELLLEQLPQATGAIADHLSRGWQAIVPVFTGSSVGRATCDSLPLRPAAIAKVSKFLGERGGDSAAESTTAGTLTAADLELLAGYLADCLGTAKRRSRAMRRAQGGRSQLFHRARRELLVVATLVAALGAALYLMGAILSRTLSPADWFQVVRDDYTILRAAQDQGLVQFDRSVDGNPLSVGGERFRTGLGTHASSALRLKVPDEATFLSGACGVDNEVHGSGSISCVVEQDGRVLFDSGILRGGEKARTFRVAISGARPIDLLMKDGGDGIEYDHGDWLNLKTDRGE